MGRPRTRSKPDREQDRTGDAFPTREYIGAMALEMARMARGEGDGRLADLLEQAANVAGRPVEVER